MMRTGILIFMLAMILAVGAMAQTDDLMISEYVEGSGSNLAVEIFNGTSDTVNLAGYAIEVYANGTTTALSIALDAVDMEPGDVFVIAHTGFSQPTLANQTDADLNFSGNDALVLAFGGVAVDRVGRVGEDPGDYWSCANGTTQNHTLRRLPGVCEGSLPVDAVFDPCDGWEFLAVDTLDGLGQHTADCGTVPLDNLPWGEIKSLFR